MPVTVNLLGSTVKYSDRILRKIDRRFPYLVDVTILVVMILSTIAISIWIF